jgi:hypothetical protein
MELYSLLQMDYLSYQSDIIIIIIIIIIVILTA